VPVWLAASGMSLAGIGLATGASLPWALKFLWAPLVDRLGSRRMWIRVCLGLLAVTTAVLAGAAPIRHARQPAPLLLLYVARPATLAEPIRSLLQRPGIWAVVLFALLFKLDISAMDPMTKPFWVASGFSLDQIAALTTGRLLATLGGAAIGGVIATRVGIFNGL